MKKHIRMTLSSMAMAFLLSSGIGPVIAAPQSGQEKTSDNQKNDKADTALTAEIRKAIVADKTLSMSAHNVKVITENGIVTLRGQVPSSDERDAVVSKAKDLAGATNVVDQLTIAPKKEK